MAKKRRRRGRSIPVLSIAIVAGQAFAAHAAGGSVGEKAARFASYYIGFDAGSRVFDPNALVIGWAPWIVKGVASKVARAVGARPRLFPGLSLS